MGLPHAGWATANQTTHQQPQHVKMGGAEEICGDDTTVAGLLDTETDPVEHLLCKQCSKPQSRCSNEV
jgi:hypothetical protein